MVFGGAFSFLRKSDQETKLVFWGVGVGVQNRRWPLRKLRIESCLHVVVILRFCMAVAARSSKPTSTIQKEGADLPTATTTTSTFGQSTEEVLEASVSTGENAKMGESQTTTLEAGAGQLRRHTPMLILELVWGCPNFLTAAILGAIP